MSNFTPLRTRKIINFLHNKFYHNKIIVLIGSKKIFLCAIRKNKLIENIFIPLSSKDLIEQYKKFLQKFKNYHIFFLLDDDECALHHESVPALHSIVKTNPIESFIQEHFSPEDIIAYYSYNIQAEATETWEVVIASTTYHFPLQQMLNYISEKSLRFGGIYFLALEFKVIIDKMLLLTNHNYNNHLQLFICMMEASTIRLVVKHQLNIISIKIIDYPTEKSISYIQGIIEQEISDCLLLHKDYLVNNRLETCIIFLVDHELQELLKQSKFNTENIIYANESQNILDKVSISDKVNILDKVSDADLIYNDQIIVKLFAEQKSFLGLNNAIKTITKLSLMNRLIFKPCILVMIILALLACKIKFAITENQQEFNKLNIHYHQIAGQYGIVKQQYPKINDVTNLVDLYSLDKLLRSEVALPFDLLNQFIINSRHPRIHFSKINWQLQNQDSIIPSIQKAQIEILMKYAADNISIEEAVIEVEQYLKMLEEWLKDYEVRYIKDDKKITNSFGKIVIPISILISQK